MQHGDIWPNVNPDPWRHMAALARFDYSIEYPAVISGSLRQYVAKTSLYHELNYHYIDIADFIQRHMSCLPYWYVNKTDDNEKIGNQH